MNNSRRCIADGGAGFAEGLYTHHLDGFEALLNQANRTDDLFARHHMMVIGDKLHPLEQQALYEWSSTVDEHSLGGMVIATTATDEDQLDRIATQVASTVLRATPNATPASVHLVPCDATKRVYARCFWQQTDGLHNRVHRHEHS